MAVDLHYSVEVKSRFALLMCDDEDSQDNAGNFQVASKNDENSKNLQKNIRVQPTPTNKTPPRNALKPTGNRVQTGIVADDTALEHQKAQHSSKLPHHARTHRPPVHGREFDRRSGSDKTGVKSIPKKDGYGTGNWGTVEDEIEATMSAEAPVDPLNNSTEDGEEQQEVAPEPVTMTLEEYKALKNSEKSIARPTGEARAPNDGKDVFKNMKVIKPVKAQEPEVHQPKFASVYQSTNESGIKISIAPPDRGSRGDRPFGRGGRGRGGMGGGERRGGGRPPRSTGEEENGQGQFTEPRAPRGGAGGPRGGNRGGASFGAEGGAAVNDHPRRSGRGGGPSRGGTRGGAPGERGGFSRGRGGGGAPGSAPTRGGGGGRSNQAPSIMNENDFPSLG